MNYNSYQNFDVINGVGARVVIWLSGCSHGCEGCFSPKTHNPNYGCEVTEDFKHNILSDLDKPFIKGLTWSGGDPLHKRNYKEVAEFSELIKNKLPTKDIWLYTGYTYEQILSDPDRCKVLSFIDVLVDGKYDKSLPPAPFRGSNNQRIIDVQKSLAQGEVVLYDV